MADRETCAKLADAVYNHPNIPSGWQQLDLDGNTSTKDYVTALNGFAAAAYGQIVYDSNGQQLIDGNGKPIYSEIVVSYRGSGDVNDWLTSNILQALDVVPAQYSNAVDFYKSIVQLFPDVGISLTGHSLGGALAQLVGASLQSGKITDLIYPYDINYEETYAFNGYGVSHLLNDLGITQTASSFSTIQNYVNMSDLVGNLANILFMGDHLGTVDYIAPTPMTSNVFYSHGQYLDEPLNPQPNWTDKQGIALWYYDINNNSLLKLALAASINEADLQSAVNILINPAIMKTPKKKLEYATTGGHIIIGGEQSGNLNGTNNLFGFGGNDTIYGLNGNDNITGGSGNDIIYGDYKTNPENGSLSGNDIINGGKGDDTLYGGAGNDTYIHNTGDGVDVIDDSDKRGRIKLNGRQLAMAFETEEDTNEYSDGFNTYVISGNDLIVNGNIRIKNFNKENKDLGINLMDSDDSEAGDTIAGESGSTSNNPISGTSKNDIIYGTDGDDVINAGDGDDVIYGGAGNDNIDCGGGNDIAFGESGNDIIDGGSGNDELHGGEGDDVIWSGGGGTDYLDGGTGNDILHAMGTKSNTLFGGTGKILKFSNKYLAQVA